MMRLDTTRSFFCLSSINPFFPSVFDNLTSHNEVYVTVQVKRPCQTDMQH